MAASSAKSPPAAGATSLGSLPDDIVAGTLLPCLPDAACIHAFTTVCARFRAILYDDDAAHRGAQDGTPAKMPSHTAARAKLRDRLWGALIRRQGFGDDGVRGSFADGVGGLPNAEAAYRAGALARARWARGTGVRGTRLDGHFSGVSACATTALGGDGKGTADTVVAVTASFDKTLRCFDGATGRCLAELGGHADAVTALAVVGRDPAAHGSGGGGAAAARRSPSAGPRTAPAASGGWTRPRCNPRRATRSTAAGTGIRSRRRRSRGCCRARTCSRCRAR